jgi:hypothetical protein
LRPVPLASPFLTLIAAVLLLASPASGRAPSPHPCEAFTPCTPEVGPWVTAPSNKGSVYTLDCPSGSRAVGVDAAFPGAIYPVGIITVGGLGLGGESVQFGAFPDQFNVTYQPAVGCSPPGATLASRAQGAAIRTPLRRRVRTVRIRPRAETRVRLGCAGARRLVHSGSAVAFFTHRPPSARVVRALEHRHRRAGSMTRTYVAAPAGVGDDERVELQVSVLCSRAG